MTYCHVSNQIANYAFRLGAEEARADAAMQYAQSHMAEMVTYLLEQDSLTFNDAPSITIQDVLEELQDSTILSDAFDVYAVDSSDELSIGKLFKNRLLAVASKLIAEHFAEHGELPNEFNLDNAA